MGAMVRRAKMILGHTDFTAIFDKGYHTDSEFDYAHKQGVEVLVAFPDVASHAPDISYDVEHFHYNKDLDEYTCPADQKLITNGHWYNKASGKTINRVNHYKTKACHTNSLLTTSIIELNKTLYLALIKNYLAFKYHEDYFFQRKRNTSNHSKNIF